MSVCRRALACSLFVLGGCSSYHQVKNVTDLKPGQRVVVGEVTVVGGTMRDWATGTFFGSELVFADALPRDSDGNLALGAHSGDDLSEGFSDFTRAGGPFSAGVGPTEAYVLGIRTYSTVWLANITALFPMVVQIPRAAGQCEYLGSIRVWRSAPGEVDFVLEDHFDRDAARLAARIKGCKLVKNLGVPLVGKFRPSLPPAESTELRVVPGQTQFELRPTQAATADARLAGWSLEDAASTRLRYAHTGRSGRLMLTTGAVHAGASDAASADAALQPALAKLAPHWHCASTPSESSWLQRPAQLRDVACTAKRGSGKLRMLSATIRLRQDATLTVMLAVDEDELAAAWPAFVAFQQRIVLAWPGATALAQP
jgi:hypothetical protein